jgi:zinc transport system substrate-binding protein
MPRRKYFIATLLSCSFVNVQSSNAVPEVVADIAPVHSLVSRVMQGVGQPKLVVSKRSSAHSYNIRPSEASAISKADVIFWIGPSLTPWLEGPLNKLAPNAAKIELMDTEKTILYAYREEAIFMDQHSDSSNHDEEHEERDAHNGHNSKFDPHMWLDPENAKLWLVEIAKALAKLDPENSTIYNENAKQGIEEIQTAVKDIIQSLQKSGNLRFIVLHDAFQYFEKFFNVRTIGSISLSDAVDPSPSRLKKIRAFAKENNVICAFSEPQFGTRMILTVIEGTDIKMSVLDPLGADLDLGSKLYVKLLRDMSDSIVNCF